MLRDSLLQTQDTPCCKRSSDANLHWNSWPASSAHKPCPVKFGTAKNTYLYTAVSQYQWYPCRLKLTIQISLNDIKFMFQITVLSYTVSSMVDNRYLITG